VLWLSFLPLSLRGEVSNPYLGIFAFLGLPAVFFGGLALIPAGIWRRRRRESRAGSYPSEFPPLDLHHTEFRRLLVFVGLTSVVNVVIAGQVTYQAVNYMDSSAFCGTTCHTVMAPEFAAYGNSPHSRVECVKCHIGPGASWFVQSKLSGVGQVFAVALRNYPTPIPTPVKNLRPARETCETCHWPQKYGGERLRSIAKFADDEANTRTTTVLLMRIGGGSRGPGIHGAHLGDGIRIRYAHTDPQRQTIPWVEYSNGKGRTEAFGAAAPPQGASVREMDCMDCHNRPTHVFDLPERAVDRALDAGDISPQLPFARKKSVELLREGGAETIAARFGDYYKTSYPAVFGERKGDIERSAAALAAIHNRNVFPNMKVTWGTYVNNIGHEDFPGCFRCHDDKHANSAGKTITQDCNACHSLLAMEEAAPKILTDLGVNH
jgi:nitrate/TMAO reductase-like tetraheme cytochrome c subunit